MNKPDIEILTDDYPDSVQRQGANIVLWSIATAAVTILVLFSIRNFWLWILLAIGAVMIWTSWRAKEGRSVPVVVVPVLEFMSNLVSESHENYRTYKENNDQANRYDVVNLHNDDDIDEYAESTERRRERRRRDAEQDFDDDLLDDDDDEEWWQL